MNIGDYLNNLNKEKLDSFLDNTDSSIVVKKNVNKQISDTSWIYMVEDCIPYLDNIIRNPRRFIVQEENIVPVFEKKKSNKIRSFDIHPEITISDRNQFKIFFKPSFRDNGNLDFGYEFFRVVCHSVIDESDLP